ncbi:MAG: glycosyltransferase family 4 protein [Deltaproteobacteria bacterium]|nr:glycosyltransferase family 4 protein [Deltaproteobacteria bacterium]MBW2071767.1 glycosyltransferase family 4 protein [Deltaproteobacteria bacterium]
MKKRIWASLDDYLLPRRQDKVVGRSVAVNNFFKALIAHGTFDEYHFFLEGQAHKKVFAEQHGTFLREKGAEEKVKIFYRTELVKQIKQYDYAIFHLADPVSYFPSLCQVRNLHAAFPITTFIHSLSYPRYFMNYLQIMLCGATGADAIICSSQSGRKVLSAYFSQLAEGLQLPQPEVRLEIIPFGFDGSVFRGYQRQQCRLQLGLGADEVIALCLARFSEYDKMDLFPLLQAFQQIDPVGRQWRLIIAGSSQSTNYVEMVQLWTRALNISANVILKTNVSEEEKLALYRAADFFVSPSDNLQETFGLTLLEAMAAGLPLIVSDFDGYRDLVADDMAISIPTRWAPLELFSTTGVAPLLAEADLHRFMAQSAVVDVVELSHALRVFFEHPEKCREMGRRARERFRTSYDYPVVLEKLETFWLELKSDFPADRMKQRAASIFPDYYAAFSHYFTEELTPETAVKATAFARSMEALGASYPLYADMGQLVDVEVVQSLIRRLTEPVRVKDLLAITTAAADTMKYQVLWMLKHGLLECC